MPTRRKTEHVDVLIIGAGISGIGAAYYLSTRCPRRSYGILERRQNLGGTWDLFRYPGIRSDSDMYTYGYAFRPWMNPKMISDGESIRRYLEETVREYGIREKIRFGVRVLRASWSTRTASWLVEAKDETTDEFLSFTCNFLIGATGYYDYDQGYTPEFAGRARFRGSIIHPQHWPEDLDYSGKRVVVIGSGATAMALVPAMAQKAKRVTMLQRSPTYVMSLPEKDPVTNLLLRLLSPQVGYRFARVRNVTLQLLLYKLSQAYPRTVRRLLLNHVRKQLGEDFDLRHFTPKYNPWDERLCVVPDGDLFRVLRSGKAEVVTDHIDCFTEKGIRLKSGEEIEADIIVTATGLSLKALGGIELRVDGKPFNLAGALAYKALMFENLPNLAMLFGYPNMSWTMKVDISCDYLMRLFNFMEREDYAICVPRNRDAAIEPTPFFALQSGYVKRAEHLLPKQGSRAPWRLYNNYWRDWLALRYSRVDDGVLEFQRRAHASAKTKSVERRVKAVRQAART